MFIAFIPAIAYAGNPLGIRGRDVVRAVGAQLVGALVSVGVGFALRFSLLAAIGPFQRMAVLGVVYFTTYMIVVLGVFRVTTPMQVCLSVVKDFLPGPLKALAGPQFSRVPKAIDPLDAALLESGEKVDVSL
jgi:hypothetical protein